MQSMMTQVCQQETLYAAWRRVRANKGGPGSDGVTIQQFERNLETHLTQLSRQLAEERYYPRPLQRFTRQKRDGSSRSLAILALQDRIVQRAVRDVLEPLFEAQFLDCSFGCRPRRGVDTAVARVMEYRLSGDSWTVHTDVASFYDTMDHQILMRLLESTVKEPPLLRLVQMWLDMGAITQVQEPSSWVQGLERTGRYVGDAVERTVSHLLHRDIDTYPYSVASPAEELSLPSEVAEMALNGTALREHISNFPEMSERVWSQAKREALTRLGRDGLLLLLSSSRGWWRHLSTRQLLLIAPVLLGAGAIPAVHNIVKAHQGQVRKVGTVQGSPLSPLLANAYLHEFDLAMTRARLRLTRFADDILILCRNEARARHALAQAQHFLGKLKLSLNENKTHIACFSEGVTFLGYVFDAEGCYRPVTDSSGQAARTQVTAAIRRGIEDTTQTGERLLHTGRRWALQMRHRWIQEENGSEENDGES